MLVHKFLMSGRMSKQLLLKIKEILKKMVLKNIISVAMQVMKFLKLTTSKIKVVSLIKKVRK